MEFIYDRINNELLAAGINDPTTFAEFATYLGYGSGGCTYQNMQVAWTPTSMAFGRKPTFALATQSGPSSFTYFDTISEGGFAFNTVTGLITVSLPNLTDISGAAWSSLFAASCPDLTSISAPLLASIQDDIFIDANPKLTTVDLNSLVVAGRGLKISTSALLTSILLNALVSIAKDVDFISNPSLTTLNFPSLTTVGGDWNADSSTALTTVNLPQFLPTDGKVVSFSGCALNAASVNQILARAVANAGYVSGGIFTQGGTSAAPTGQGIVDKATLNGRQVGLATTN